MLNNVVILIDVFDSTRYIHETHLIGGIPNIPSCTAHEIAPTMGPIFSFISNIWYRVSFNQRKISDSRKIQWKIDDGYVFIWAFTSGIPAFGRIILKVIWKMHYNVKNDGKAYLRTAFSVIQFLSSNTVHWNRGTAASLDICFMTIKRSISIIRIKLLDFIQDSN